jgi:hypothetical protein
MVADAASPCGPVLDIAFHHFRFVLGRPVIDDDDLRNRDRLSKNALDHVMEKFESIVDRNDYGNVLVH